MYTRRLQQLKKVRGRAYISTTDGGEIFTVIASWLNKTFLFLLQGVVVLTSASWQLPGLGGRWQHEGGAEHGAVSVFRVSFLHLQGPACLWMQH